MAQDTSKKQDSKIEDLPQKVTKVDEDKVKGGAEPVGRPRPKPVEPING